jgi:hypothetical protein
MASAKVMARQSERQRRLAARIEQISRCDMLDRLIYRTLPEYRNGGGRPELCRMRLVQNDGTGAATVEYETEHSIRVFAKLYFDDSGAHSYEIMRTLWKNGFGPEDPFQVAEPLGFFPEYNLLLTRAAPGLPVASASNDSELAAGARRAADWLVHLHRSSLRVGSDRYPWEAYHKLIRRLAKASAKHPDKLEGMTELLDRWEAACSNFELKFVQAHGQFRHIHVFVSNGKTTVIDLDRSRPSDPGKDLAEFIHRMRTHAFKASGGATRAAEATDAFLGHYAAQLPENLANLFFYWGYHTLVSLWRFMKSSTTGDQDWERMTDYYKSEFEYALSHAKALGARL